MPTVKSSWIDASSSDDYFLVKGTTEEARRLMNCLLNIMR